MEKIFRIPLEGPVCELPFEYVVDWISGRHNFEEMENWRQVLRAIIADWYVGKIGRDPRGEDALPGYDYSRIPIQATIVDYKDGLVAYSSLRTQKNFGVCNDATCKLCHEHLVSGNAVTKEEPVCGRETRVVTPKESIRKPIGNCMKCGAPVFFKENIEPGQTVSIHEWTCECFARAIAKMNGPGNPCKNSGCKICYHPNEVEVDSGEVSW